MTIKRYSYAYIFGASALALVASQTVSDTAFAQDAAQADDAEEVEEIIVTGSRIRRAGFEDIPQPAVVLDAGTIEKRGFVNIADALNEIPGLSGFGVTGVTTASGQNVGQEFVDLFDLGTQRTLTVVNGRRFVPGNVLSAAPIGRLEGAQVDLNTFSPALVERIEVLSVGGAPIYGADAIAGTVNVILKDDYQGAEVRFQYGNRFNPNSVDNYNVEAVFGANTGDGRGNVTASIQFEDQRGAVANDFPRLRDQATAFGNGADESIIGDEGRFNILEGPTGFLPAPTPGVPFPGFGVNVFTDADGNVLTFPGTGGLEIFDPGTQVGTSFIFFEGGSGFDLTDFQETLVPVQRFTFASTAHYDVTDTIRLFAETNFLNSSSTDLISQSETAFNSAFLGTQGIGAFGVSINNPFINDGDRQLLIDSGAGQTIWLNGINLGLLPDAGQNRVDTTTYRVVGGVSGSFEGLGRNFDYEFSMNYGRTLQTRSRSLVLAGQFFNAVDSVRLDDQLIAQLTDPDNLDLLFQTTNSSAINVIRNGEAISVAPTDAQVGDIVCRTIVNPPGPVDLDGDLGVSGQTPSPDPEVAGCTPLNLFAGANASPEAIDFITAPAVSSGRISQADFVGYMTGDLIELPAGWSQFTVGFERRREFGSFNAGGVLEDGLSREPAVPSIPQTEIVSNEFFAEAVIPVLSADLLADMGMGTDFISGVEVSGAYRRIDTNINEPVNVYTAGGTLRMLDNQLTLRGNFTRSVRQPSIVELFAPPAQAFDQTGDPCDERNINEGSAARPQNCLIRAMELGFADAFLDDVGDGNVALVLAPGDDRFQTPSVNAAIPLTTAGNENLIFEVANSWTAGFIYQPEFIPNLTVGADYISINLRDVIVEPDFSFFTQDCFDNSDFSSGNFRDSCDNFFRSGPAAPVDNSVISGFDIVTGSSGFQNSETFEIQAIQGRLRYAFDVRNFANWFSGLTGMADEGTSDLGAIDFRATFYAPTVVKNSADAIPRQPDGSVTNQVGQTPLTGQAELTFTADINYTYDRFSFFWRTTYIDNASPCFIRVEGDCDDVPPEAKVLPFDLEHDASIAYQITDNVEFRGGVDNIMGNRLSREEQAYINFGGNELGRSFFLRLNARL